jgi:hypothetical protein
VHCNLWAVWLCSSVYSSLFEWGVGVGSCMQQQVSCSVFYPLVYQTYKAANKCGGEWAADSLQKTKLFRTQLCAKPCYVCAMEICSTFSCCKHCKMVAWGGIEPPTQGFSEHVFVKNPLFAVPAAGFRDTCYRPCYSKTT